MMDWSLFFLTSFLVATLRFHFTTINEIWPSWSNINGMLWDAVFLVGVYTLLQLMILRWRKKYHSMQTRKWPNLINAHCVYIQINQHQFLLLLLFFSFVFILLLLCFRIVIFEWVIFQAKMYMVEVRCCLPFIILLRELFVVMFFVFANFTRYWIQFLSSRRKRERFSFSICHKPLTNSVKSNKVKEPKLMRARERFLQKINFLRKVSFSIQSGKASKIESSRFDE